MSFLNSEIGGELKVQPEARVRQIYHDSQDVIEALGLQLHDNGFIKWKTDSPDHPRNWSVLRKTFDTGLIFFFDFFTLVAPVLIL
jgi:hypothetical protein